MDIPAACQRHFVVQPHPAAEAAIATVLAQGAREGTYDVSDSQELPPHTNGYQDVAQKPIGPVYGGNPQRALDRQPTFGKVCFTAYSACKTLYQVNSVNLSGSFVHLCRSRGSTADLVRPCHWLCILKRGLSVVAITFLLPPVRKAHGGLLCTFGDLTAMVLDHTEGESRPDV